MGRQFYCRECSRWEPVDPEEGFVGSRRKHALQHRDEWELFNSPEMVELDAMLNGFYGDLS